MAKERAVLIEAPSPRIRWVLMTSGVGVSRGFAIGEKVINELCNGVPGWYAFDIES